MILREMFGQHLRWGNFAFMWAYNIKLQKKFGYEAQYPDYYLWKYLENPPVVYEKEPSVDLLVRPKRWGWTQEEMDEIEKLDFKNMNISFALNHFMQSYKWWEGYEREVYNSLKIKQEEIEKVKDKYDYLFNSSEYCPTIGISIRLGDFQNHGDFYQIPFDWYTKALVQEFPNYEERKVVVFSDHIEHAKEIFKGCNFYFAEPNNTHTHTDNFKHYHSEKAAEQFILGTLCQPVGTKIKTPSGDINIENLKVGDKVLSYSTVNSKWIGIIGNVKKRGAPVGRNINSISEKYYSGNLVKIKTTSNKHTSYTPDHICIAKVGEAFLNKTLVYLMRKGDNFRVGISTPIKCKNKAFNKLRGSSDVRMRFRTEKADECWILSTWDNPQDARWEEILISYKYQIPQVQFVGDNKVDNFWKNFGSNVEQGILCLQDFNRDFRYPFYTSKKEVKLDKDNLLEIRACNLLNDMWVLDYDSYINMYNGKGKGKDAWVNIEVTYEKYEGLVYSMDVEINNTYVGDGIITHNCDDWIIGNSTFSWWMAWLATYNKPFSKVVHCGEVFRGKRKQENDITHYYHPSWIKVKI